MEPGQYIEVIRDRSNALLSAASRDPKAPIAGCPGWSVTDLVAHVGSAWGWSANVVATGERADFPIIEDGLSGSETIEWARSHVERLFSELEKADPDADCWTFGQPRTKLFWFRRQALETTVHAWDVQQAVGEADPIDAELAVEGIDEFLTSMLPRHIKGHPEDWSGESIHLHRIDGDGEWIVRLGPDGVAVVEQTHGKGDVALRGPAASLYLWSLNRIGTDDLEVFGDQAIADRWSAKIAF